MKRLIDICDIQYGYAFDSKCFTEDSSYPQLVRIRDVKRGYSETYYSGDYPEEYILSEGDLLVGMDGEFNIARWKSSGALLNQRVCKLTAKVGINGEYIRFAMSKALKEIERKTAFVTVKHLSAKELNKLELDVPKLSEQDRIADTLNRLEKVIEARQEELDKLDDLIKARFVEMFGEPQNNPFNWEIVNISEVVSGKVSNGFFAKRDNYYDDGNVSVLGVANIVNRMYSKVDELPRTNANDNDLKKFGVKYGDMLFCRSSLVAEGIGKASIVPEDAPSNILFECHVIRLPLNLRVCVPEFMQTLSTMDFFRNQVISQSKTATMTTIGQNGILKTNIILPPIEKQREFYNFVHQVDKSKVAVLKIF
ncbi:MAG: restriction endonuclease subunit S [Roseburia sp.]